MIMVLLQWIYIAILSFLLGYGVLAPFGRKDGWRPRYGTSYFMAGLLALNIYAEYFSLFAGVGRGANALALVIALAAGFWHRKEMVAFWREKIKATKPVQFCGYALLALLFAYGSSRGYMHWDTGLYHAQSIRWIEEYGVVPGLANLHNRFGYNSAAFALCALFGGSGLTRYPMHCVAGFFALLCAVKCTGLAAVFTKRRVGLQDFLYGGCIFYLVAVFRELVSPASDYFAMLLLFFAVLCMAELAEAGEGRVTPYGLLALCLVWAVTVKLSCAVMLLLVIYPAWRLLSRKQWGQIVGYLSLGLVIALPWLLRNVIISGWLFYPFPWLDIFSADWKIPRGYMDYDRFEIQVYAKEIYDVLQKDQPFGTWWPHWLKAQPLADRALVLAGWVCVPAAALLLVRRACKRLRASVKGAAGFGTATDLHGMLLLASLVGFLFWQFGAPLVRYGYFYVLFLPLTLSAEIWKRFCGGKRDGGQFFPDKRALRIFQGLVVAFLLYKGYNLGNMITELAGQPYYVYQQDYGSYEAFTYEVDGVVIYVPLWQGQIGYDKFPSSPVVQDIRLRGDGLASGFRRKEGD